MSYNKEEILEKVCEGLLNGNSLRKICLEEGMPNKSTVLRWLNEEDEFATTIARARDLQADSLFDDMTEIVNEMINGNIDATTAKTAIWSKQWQASKLKPKKYGDRILNENQALNKDGQPTDPADNLLTWLATMKHNNGEDKQGD